MESKLLARQVFSQLYKHWPEACQPENRFTWYLYRVKELSAFQLQAVMKPYELSATEFDLLAALRNSPHPWSLTPTQLRQAMLITSGGLTKLLYGLEARGLISRSVQAQDKRSKLVHLTAEGKARIEDAMTAVLAYDQSWIEESLSPVELNQLNELMKKLNQTLEQRIFNGAEPGTSPASKEQP